MPEFQITSPDGKKFRVTAPDGATREQALEKIKSQYKPQNVETPADEPEKSFISDVGGRVKDEAAMRLIGIPEAGATMASGTLAEPIAGLAGLGAGAINLIPGVDVGNPGEVVERTQEALTYQPRSESGKKAIGAVGSALDPVAEGLEWAEQTLGEGTQDLTGSALLAAAAATIPTAILEMLGVGLAKGGAKAAVRSGAVSEGIEKAAVRSDAVSESVKKADIRQAIKDGDKSSVNFKIDNNGRIVSDPAAKELIKQGFDEQAAMNIKSLSIADNKSAIDMVEMVDAGLKNRKNLIRNPPSKVIGDTVMERFNVVQKENRKAGVEIGRAVNKIKDDVIDTTDIMDSFSDSLEKLGVGFEMKSNRLELDVKGSLVDGNSSAKHLKWVNNRLKGSDSVKNLQDTKRYLDQQINWDNNPTNQKPMDRVAVQALKDVRSGINNKIRSLSDEYASANDRFSQTIGGMNDVMDVMGKRFDPDSPNVGAQVGQEMRKTLSNYGVGPDMIKAIDGLDAISSKFGHTFNNNPADLALLYSDIERVFGSFKPNSLQGVMEKGVSRGLKSAAKGNIKEGVLDAGVDAVVNKVQGISEKNAIKAIKDLLRK